MTGDGVNDAPALKRADVGIAVDGATDAARTAAAIVLLKPGLHTIVDGIATSRQIFQRMRSYALYRITSTIHFLLFLFVVILAYSFTIPAKLIVLIAMLNDAAVLVISVDNARVSPRPDKWRLGQLITLSFILDILLSGFSFAHFFVAKYTLNVPDDQLETIMYLQLSSSPHFVIFSTRLAGPWYTSPPSLVFFLAVFLTQVFAMFISVYGVLATPIGWPWSASVLTISLFIFMLLDIVKCWVFKHWTFEVTAKLWPTAERRKKLQHRAERAIIVQRVAKRIRKMHYYVNWEAYILQHRKDIAKKKADGTWKPRLLAAPAAVAPAARVDAPAAAPAAAPASIAL